MIDDNDPRFVKFCARREAFLKSIRKKLETEEDEEAVKTLVEFEEAMQYYSNKHGLIITAVPSDSKGAHFCFTPSEPTKLSDLVFPTEFLEQGE